jgi:hypothetical protein
MSTQEAVEMQYYALVKQDNTTVYFINQRYGLLLNPEFPIRLGDLLDKVFDMGKATGRQDKIRELRKVIGL